MSQWSINTQDLTNVNIHQLFCSFWLNNKVRPYQQKNVSKLVSMQKKRLYGTKARITQLVGGANCSFAYRPVCEGPHISKRQWFALLAAKYEDALADSSDFSDACHSFTSPDPRPAYAMDTCWPLKSWPGVCRGIYRFIRGVWALQDRMKSIQLCIHFSVLEESGLIYLHCMTDCDPQVA